MTGGPSTRDTTAHGGPRDTPDATSSDRDRWILPLTGSGVAHENAVRELHDLLLRAATFEVRRRAAAMGYRRDSELADIAAQAADDALVTVLAKITTFEERSRFTTWAYKFAVNIAGVAVRRRAWADRQIPLPAEALDRLADLTQDPAARAEERELLAHIGDAMTRLTEHQRRVLVALTLDGVPIDVLAERLSTNRNALYKTLHDARRRLRAVLDEDEVTL